MSPSPFLGSMTHQDSETSEKAVELMIKVYYSERTQAKSAKEKVPEAKFKRKYKHASRCMSQGNHTEMIGESM